jgi:hypothetical protein
MSWPANTMGHDHQYAGPPSAKPRKKSWNVPVRIEM